MHSLCQCQLQCLLMFACPSLVSPKQSSSFQAPVTSVTTSKYYTSKLQKMNLWFSPLLLRLNIFVFLKSSLILLITDSAHPNSLQILPLLPLSISQHPPNYPPQHSTTPDPCPFNYHYICIIQLIAPLLSSALGCCLPSLIPLRYFLLAVFLPSLDILTHFCKSTSWFFSLFLIPPENYFLSCLVSATPPSSVSAAEFVNLFSVLSWRSLMKHETRPTSLKSLWHISIHNLICCSLSPPFTLFLEPVFRPLDSVHIQSNLN